MIGGRAVRRLVAVLALVGGLSGSLASPAWAASRVTLHSGREIVGEVQKHETDGYWVTTTTGKIHVPATQVKSIVAVRTETTKERLADSTRHEQVDVVKEALDRRRKAREDSTADDANAEYEKIMEALRYEILSGMRSNDRTVREKAIDRLVSLWPTTAAVLDAALEDESARVRKEATRLLSNPKLGDCTDRAIGRLRDPSTVVQVLAIRAMRHRKMTLAESSLVRALASVREWPVHQEALRTLEEIGSDRCAEVVVRGLADTQDEQRKRWFVRVLEAVLGVDHGTDVEAWKAEIEARRMRQMLAGEK